MPVTMSTGQIVKSPAQDKFWAWAGDDGDKWIEQYGKNLRSMEDVANEIGIGYNKIIAALATRPDISTRAREARAAALHDKALSAVLSQPLEYTDKEGNVRIDSGYVQYRNMQANHLAKLSGILSRQYAEQSKQVEVEHTAKGALGQYLSSIMDKGSTIPIATGRTIDHDDTED